MPGDSESVVDLATAGGQLGIESFHADFELAMRRFLASSSTRELSSVRSRSSSRPIASSTRCGAASDRCLALPAKPLVLLIQVACTAFIQPPARRAPRPAGPAVRPRTRAAPSAAHAHAVARPLEIRRFDVDDGVVMSADSEQDVHPASARRMGSRQEMQLSPRGKSSGCVMRMCCKSNSVPYMGCGGY